MKDEKKKGIVKNKPAFTPEARENQLISRAMDLAEQKILDGTASSQIITHFLKLGSSSEKINKEIMEKQKNLIDAKIDNLQTAKHIEVLYENAMAAMKRYSGTIDERDDTVE